MRNLSVERICLTILGPTRLAGATPATVAPSPISAAPVDPLIFASPAAAADTTTTSSPGAVTLDAVGKFSSAGGPFRIFFGETLARAGASTLLAAALVLGADQAHCESNSSPRSSTPAWADPLHWGSSPEATKLDSPGAVASLDAVRQISAAKNWSRIGFASALACGGAFALLAAAFTAIRRRRRRRLRLQNLFEVREILDEPIDAPQSPGEVQAPRFLPSNPYVDPQGPRRLGRQIEHAAEASLEFGRVLGVIFFDLGDPPTDPSGGSTQDWSEDAAGLVSNLRPCLRPTDHVALLADRYVVVCIALLPGMTELIGIAERVRGIGQTSPTFAAAFARQPGLSIFPLCGYRGDELIAYARTNFYVLNSLVPAQLPGNAGELEPATVGKG